MQLQQLIAHIAQIAPPNYQESYDNAGLLTGNPQQSVTGVLLCLDSLEAVVDEAIAKGCNVVIAHHPIIFGGLKSLTGKNYVERIVIKAIQHNIAIYACHTNLDNVRKGVNAKICERLGLQNTRILVPKNRLLRQLSTYVPVADAEQVRSALFAAGAGNIGNYVEASFNAIGAGTYKGNDQSNGYRGEKNVRHYEAETKIEVLYAQHLEAQVLSALRQNHPYEEIAYNIITLDNAHNDIGSGMIGSYEDPIAEDFFLDFLKNRFNTGCVRHTALRGQPIKTVAVCGGSGSFLLRNAIAANADVFVTADFKYHEFFDADNRIIIADIGHYESEQFTIELFGELLAPIMGDTPLFMTDINTNPVLYY